MVRWIYRNKEEVHEWSSSRRKREIKERCAEADGWKGDTEKVGGRLELDQVTMSHCTRLEVLC